MKKSPALLWFRLDLRLHDQPAVSAAALIGVGVVPVFIWDVEAEGDWAYGGAGRVWLHESLKMLDLSLRRLGSRLIFRKGKTMAVMESLIKETGATHLYWTRRYEPGALDLEKKIKANLSKSLHCESFPGNLLFEPGDVLTREGKPFRVFTPFYRELQKRIPRAPLPAVKKLPSPPRWPAGLSLKDLGLTPKHSWAKKIMSSWKPGEAAALGRFRVFKAHHLAGYPEGRDVPSTPGTSRLSPHLHFGEISPRLIWRTLHESALAGKNAAERKGAEHFLRELAWREFAHALLYYYPHTPALPLYPRYTDFPWREGKEFVHWEKGQTGYPIIDAGMRELWATGWMHNRVRMIVSSFLVKDLLISWTRGAAWFWETLVDADLSNNTLGWQWSAGCGADAAPFFRIFNPTRQGEKFDPLGAYTKKWVPELKRLPPRWIHKPWAAPEDVLKKSGVQLGKTYPLPLIDHDTARIRALEAFQKTKTFSPRPQPIF